MNTFVSVSRRSDIPAYYADWFANRLRMGYTVYPNPISGKPVFMDLTRNNVLGFIFWTRNPRPLFRHLDYIDSNFKQSHYMHYTVNLLPEEIEPVNIPLESTVDNFKFLFDRYGENYIQWRFDPIILSNITDENFYYKQFEMLAKKLSGLTRRCYFSFVDFYNKTKHNLSQIQKHTNLKFVAPDIVQQKRIAGGLAKIAKAHNIDMYACAEDILLTVDGINKARCVDLDLLKIINPNLDKSISMKPTRFDCGCSESKDIGYYESCPNGCVYCYSNKSSDTARMNAKNYISNGFPMDSIELHLFNEQYIRVISHTHNVERYTPHK